MLCSDIAVRPLAHQFLAYHANQNVASVMVCTGFAIVEELDISFSVVTDFGLLQLAASSPRLQKLTLADLDVVNVWTCALYTEYGLAELQRLRPSVQQCLVFI